jgi:hypothetical protein
VAESGSQLLVERFEHACVTHAIASSRKRGKRRKIDHLRASRPN